MIDNDTKAKQGVKADYAMLFTWIGKTDDKRKDIYNHLAKERKAALDLRDSCEELLEDNKKLRGEKGWRHYWENLTNAQATVLAALVSSPLLMLIIKLIWDWAEMGSAG